MAGGNYVRFDDASCAMNPLQMELNPRNRDFLATWLKLITDLTDEGSAEQFGMALDMLEHIPVADRNLMKIWNTAFPADSKARTAIRPWISENRSEEHTSELQQLMRNSYAVFCLTKKKIK